MADTIVTNDTILPEIPASAEALVELVAANPNKWFESLIDIEGRYAYLHELNSLLLKHIDNLHIILKTASPTSPAKYLDPKYSQASRKRSIDELVEDADDEAQSGTTSQPPSKFIRGETSARGLAITRGSTSARSSTAARKTTGARCSSNSRLLRGGMASRIANRVIQGTSAASRGGLTIKVTAEEPKGLQTRQSSKSTLGSETASDRGKLEGNDTNSPKPGRPVPDYFDEDLIDYDD
ncbi:hypothetical protein BDY21DRAFT_168044 [Lineolata rhizophorae]|uniref:Uncharacterized protein n=1 Tax=Lineolata rhizophorae TaxID=578093 RepID=A0A6A6P9D7_9PEZI|nr:hypothetical protein BDY21DRAFT_168044 [Lineolata rhizophorae]